MEIEIIEKEVYKIRGQIVKLDFDVADEFKIDRKLFRKIILNNRNRLEDKIFRLTKEEFSSLKRKNKENKQKDSFSESLYNCPINQIVVAITGAGHVVLSSITDNNREG